MSADGSIRPEEHVRLAHMVLRRADRHYSEDDLGFAILSLVQAANLWNEGIRPCAWSTFAAKKVWWDWYRRNFNRGAPRTFRREVPLFLQAKDEDDELERWEMAVEDPGLGEAEARADVDELLKGLSESETLVLRRRFGLGGEPATRAALGAEMGVGRMTVARIERRALARLRKRATRGTFTIPLDSPGSERLR